MSCLPGHCRTSEDLKYTMTRLAVDGADLFVVEHGCAANIKVTASGITKSIVGKKGESCILIAELTVKIMFNLKSIIS